MPLSNYTELKASVADYLARSDMTSVIDDWITLTEDTVNKRLRTSRRSLTAALTTDADGLVDLPDDFRELKTASIRAPYRAQLDIIGSGDAANSDTTAGTTWGAQIVGDQLQIYPPGISTVYLEYYQKVPSLVVTGTTNWLLETSPKVYLYGCLAEAQPYLKDWAQATTWLTLFTQALNDLMDAEVAATGGGRMRIKGATP